MGGVLVARLGARTRPPAQAPARTRRPLPRSDSAVWARAVAQCRVEAMLGAAYPTHYAATRATLFRGALRSALLAGRRPHAIFGDKEVARRTQPLFLMPLLHATFDAYKPEEGNLTNPLDKETIEVLSRKARAKWPKLEVGYVRGFAYTGGAGGGEGKHVYADGCVYVGQFKDGKKHGRGTYTDASGVVYEGEWQSEKQHGRGTYTFADGAVYEGEWQSGLQHGRGTYTYASGAVYEGEYQSGVRHGRGTFTYADGATEVGRYEAGKDVGEAAKWSATRKAAWRVQDGRVGAAISLEEAAEIAARVGLPVPS